MDKDTNKYVLKRFIQVLITLVIQMTIVFVSANTLKYNMAWFYVLLSIIILLINLKVLPVEVIIERGQKKKNTKKWDKIITGINIIPTLLMYVFCGLDFRFGWTHNLSIYVNVIGFILTFLGSMLFTWSMVSNHYFSTVVRIQKERKHKTVTSGPYKYVRHPGYVGFILMTLPFPLALGSLYALIFAGISCILFIIRTYLEDKTLTLELEGYKQYKEKVKYRLIPFIW